MNQIDIWQKFESHLLNEGVSNSRLKKMKTMFSLFERGFNKPLDEVTKEDIEDFVDRLHKNTFVKQNSMPFSGATKSDIKKTLKQFFKWFKGEGYYYPREVSWIRGKISKDEQPKEKEILNIDQIKRLASAFSDVKKRLLTLLLFDTGFRIGEILSVKKKNITWESFDGEQCCFWVECLESKTEKRKIPAPLFTEDLQAFFNSIEFEQKSPDDKAFDINYDNYRISLRRKSLDLFKKIVTPHALRHSSATYYSKLFDGNMNLLAERYGWSFGSRQLRTYIRRSGAYQKAGVKKIFDNETTKLQREINEYKTRIEQLQEEIYSIKTTMKQKNT